MEVKSSNDGMLTNVEVLELLREKRAKNTNSGNSVTLQEKEAVELQTLNYLEDSIIGKMSSEVLVACVSELKKLHLKLTEAELIHIANFGPQSELDFYLMIEDVNDRFSEEQLSTITNIVQKYFK